MKNLQESLKEAAVAFEDAFSRLLATASLPQGQRVSEAMRYSALAGGKRLRPFLLKASSDLLGAETQEEQLWRAAAAVEAAHTFSLIHDDLPCIDNDSLRRGQPTCHVRFDEATAVLAGDGLLNWAHGLLAAPETHPSADVRIALVQALARAVNTLIHGEMWDILAERDASKTMAEADLAQLQRMKTGAMFDVCVHMAGVLNRAEPEAMAALEHYTAHLGLAFQMTDDVLDTTGTAAELGKTPGKDATYNKATFVTCLGAEETKRRAAAEIAQAQAALAPFGARAENLQALARYVLERTH
jgi:farnesyl diphosphate synthase